jgi:hypothetical protein
MVDNSESQAYDSDVCSSLKGLPSPLDDDGRHERGQAVIVRAADGNEQDDLVDHAVEEEALERYYRRRIQEIQRDERRPGGASWTLDEVKRMAGERPSVDRRSG